MAMQQVNIHQAKTQLSALLEQVRAGESFVIAKAGRPVAVVSPYSSTAAPPNRIGFLAGQIHVPDDFDELGRDEIAAMFGDSP